MNRDLFYSSVRSDLFNGKLSQPQVDGIEAILNFWESPPVEPTGEFKTNWDIRSISWLAYMLATTYHETAFTMQPISEFGDDARFTRLMEGVPELGNDQPGDGARFHGRGYVQLTGRRNYTVMTPVVRHFYPGSPDFTEDPEAVKDPKFAAIILFYGMFQGSFTGRALKHFIGDPDKGQSVDFFNARKIINGLDRAEDIQSYAKKFAQALDLAGTTTATLAKTTTTAKTIYVKQPNDQFCQAACIAMALGTTDVHSIRAELVANGVAGDPAVMGGYLRPRAKSYKFLIDGSLNDAKKALDEGCVVITHGWFTRFGHVIVLIGHEADPDTLSSRFIVHDPWAEYNFPKGDHDDDKSGEGVLYSSYGMYATCVASADYDHSRDLYSQKKLDINAKNAWLHIIKN